MYDELVKRLRNRRICIQQLGTLNDYPLLEEAADAIEELTRENKELSFRSAQLEAMNDALIGETGTADALMVVSQPRWIPVTERLPEKNQIVVVVQHGKTWDYGQFRGLDYLGGDVRKWIWKNNTTKTVDCWMPKKSALPEPPKEE